MPRPPISPAAEAIVGKTFPVLDHGFIRLVDLMGSDESIVQAARVSYGAGTKTAREDAGLIHYLVRNKHTSPLEMCEYKFHCKMPIFVARQWVRHRMASLNEVSARYSVLEDEFYIPDTASLTLQHASSKQARTEEPIADAEAVRQILKDASSGAYGLYEELLEKGLARELARMVLPVNIYTQWYWKIDLHNLLNFIRLRYDAHAQSEIRDYGKVLYDIVETCNPVAHAAFVEHVINARTFSYTERRILDELIGYAPMSIESLAEKAGFSKNQTREFLEKLEV